MTAADVEQDLDEQLLEQLDFAPPCELDGVHQARNAPICAADEAVKIQAPCLCAAPQIVLMCLGCDKWLATAIAHCNDCHRQFCWHQVAIERTPL